MKTKGNYFKLLLVTISISIILSLLACGGGGGGGGSDNSYSGLTTPAEINENNAAAISTEAYMTGSNGDIIGGNITGIQAQEDIYNIYPRSLLLSQTFKKALQRIDIISTQGNVIMGATQSESGSENGSCGGSVSWTLSVNDQTGSFTGDFNFNAYCEEDISISGKAGVSGNVNLSTGKFEQFHMTFTDLTGQSQIDSFTINGTMDMSFDSSTATVTMNFDNRDNNTGKVYRLENYIISSTDDYPDISVVVSGKFYSPDYGYVILSTQTPLLISYSDIYPYEGVLVCEGKTGIAGGSTKARLTVLSSVTYEVEADTNGDGSYDWTSGLLYWSNL